MLDVYAENCDHTIAGILESALGRGLPDVAVNTTPGNPASGSDMGSEPCTALWAIAGWIQCWQATGAIVASTTVA